MERDIQASVRRPEEEGIVSLRSRCKSVGGHCCACTSMNVRCAHWPQVHSRLQSNDRSTIDAVAGDLRTNGHLHQQQQGRPVNLIAQHNFFARMEGWCRCTRKPSAGNLSRNPTHACKKTLQLIRCTWGGAGAGRERSQKSAQDDDDKSDQHRCEEDLEDSEVAKVSMRELEEQVLSPNESRIYIVRIASSLVRQHGMNNWRA